MTIEPGLIAETVNRWSLSGDHGWCKCRVIAIDEADVIIRWLDGEDAGVINWVDDDPEFWRECKNG